MRKWQSFLLGSLCLFSIAIHANETKTIGVLYWSMNIPGQVAMRKGLEAEAEKINQQAAEKNLPMIRLMPYVAGDGDEGVERQITQMQQLIEQKVDAIIAQPTDNAALAYPLIEANKANIPVIAYDQYIKKGELAAYVTSNNYQAGYLDGEYVAANFDADYTIKLIIVEYPLVSSTVQRVNGFIDALDEYDQAYDILSTYEAVEPVSGKEAGLQILQEYPEKGSVDVIFTVNDGGGLSVVDELANAGRDEIFIATIDGDPKSVENIKQKRLTRIDSAQFCGPLGAEALKLTYALLIGEDIPAHSEVPVFPITQETLDIYPGWMGPVPDKFTKPWASNDTEWRGEMSVIEE
ncbi:sugar ABC transporter substrate-binding protein [Candidatus Albibeggiatoa sp. nov. NOAA]|uniref:sugar ABC transporter substrate-binding protein n=1 Tax=Candidatus Albibeggiatoa sp. nov. NOAA TaxID=3162724 RepID=UPI0032FBB793|nr:sugar ABC transporter substrate-binding protein [Thiotrichaceae bacterium]